MRHEIRVRTRFFPPFRLSFVLLVLSIAAGDGASAQTVVHTGGGAGCIPTPGDFDGDGDWDFAQLCGGGWHFYRADGSYWKGIWTGAPETAFPVPADYTGDGRTEVALFNLGGWHFYDFETGAYRPELSRLTGVDAIPVPMDHDGDSRAEFTIYDRGAWHFFHDDGSYHKGIWIGDTPGNVPVPFDRNADAREDVVLFNGGGWHFFDFATGAYLGGIVTPRPDWGAYTNPRPTPLDFDGDGDFELGIYEVSGGLGLWHFFQTGGTLIETIDTGAANGDRPISRRLLP